MKLIFWSQVLLIFIPFYAQAQVANPAPNDTLVQELETVILTVNTTASNKESLKPLGSLEEHLSTLSDVNMIHRGAYAAETMLQGMSSERSIITIDGMRVYGACTDKMDPITAYIDLANVSQIEVQSGAHSQLAGSIAGSMQVNTKQGTFKQMKDNWQWRSGIEFNNLQRIFGVNYGHNREKYYLLANLNYRKAENYLAADRKEVLYSGFTKYNSEIKFGYKLNEHQTLTAAVLYDRAKDIGYPGLPMDVALAQGLLTNIKYYIHQPHKKWRHLDAQIYFNKVVHVMDDSHRPSVPIRMDMPGWSTTFGWNGNAHFIHKKHEVELKAQIHHNQSLAEMTMFANNLDDLDMFMLTWPDVRTTNSSLLVQDEWRLNEKWIWKNIVGSTYQYQQIGTDFGKQSLAIFYPNFNGTRSDYLFQLMSQIGYHSHEWLANLSIGYNERAPSVSEGFGFYLFNSFDKYDYIGNPYLQKERAFSAQSKVKWMNTRHQLTFSASYYYFLNYIIGLPNPQMSSMTIGANGVRIYQDIDKVNLANVSLDWVASWYFWLNSKTNISWRTGRQRDLGYLPMLQPLQFMQQWNFQLPQEFSFQAKILAHAPYATANNYFGEQNLPAFAVLDLGVQKVWNKDGFSLQAKLGVQNLLDHNYTTFADWNRIPQMGRNVFLHLLCSF